MLTGDDRLDQQIYWRFCTITKFLTWPVGYVSHDLLIFYPILITIWHYCLVSWFDYIVIQQIMTHRVSYEFQYEHICLSTVSITVNFYPILFTVWMLWHLFQWNQRRRKQLDSRKWRRVPNSLNELQSAKILLWHCTRRWSRSLPIKPLQLTRWQKDARLL